MKMVLNLIKPPPTKQQIIDLPSDKTICLYCGNIYDRVYHQPDEVIVEECWKCVHIQINNKDYFKK